MGDKRNAKSYWEMLQTLFQIGVAILIATGFLTSAKDRFLFLFDPASLKYFPIPHLSVILQIVSIFLIFQWVYAVYTEKQMLKDHFEDIISAIPKYSFLWTVIAAITLAWIPTLVFSLNTTG